MADIIKKSTNKFTKGLIMDFSPENTQNEVLTHALNATLLTFNGNEMSLQNDMGNGRVETAFLPEGYMPVGTCEYGGIIYIVSYNPLEDKSQIGCFPSPERNISNDELGISDAIIDRESFQKFEDGKPTGDLIQTTQHVILKNDSLNPGDKFIIQSEKSIYKEFLQDLYVNDGSGFKLKENPILSLNIVSIEDSGKIVYLNNSVRQYNVDVNNVNYKYHILGEMSEDSNFTQKIDIDSYRNVLSSGYSVFKSKTSGKLAILVELIMIDSYSVTHSVKRGAEEGEFDVVIHTEITPTLDPDSYNILPKLKYFYLKNSQGNLSVFTRGNERVLKLFNDEGNFNDAFLETKLSSLYEYNTEDEAEYKLFNQEIGYTGKFNFPKPNSYHGRMVQYKDTLKNDLIFTKFTEGKYHRIDKSQISNDLYTDYYKNTINAKFYYFVPSNTAFEEYKNDFIDETLTYYVKDTEDTYIDVKRNEKYKEGYELYKINVQPSLATDNEIKNTSIEKFIEENIIRFRPAVKEDLNKNYTFHIQTINHDTGKIEYIEYSGSGLPDIGGSTTYYVKEVESNLKSIGYDLGNDVYNQQIWYYPNTKTYELASQEDLNNYWDFSKYPMTNTEPYGSPVTLYLKQSEDTYRLATVNEISNRDTLLITLYYNTNYVYIPNLQNYKEPNQVFITVPMDTYVPYSKFKPDLNYNYIIPYHEQSPQGPDKPEDGYPDEQPIELCTVSDFIPSKDEDDANYLAYGDIKLAKLKLPRTVLSKDLNLPFKYDYTIVPCMNYGKLDHLAMSNTIDFSKLNNFNASQFTTWKYRIDGNQLRLTFGADVYDTYEDNKVDGLILEFYDLYGFAGSLEITDKKSYSGIFTKIINLNSLGALSTKRIVNNQYSSAYHRNINIINEPNSDGSMSKVFKLNNTEVSLRDPISGWGYEDGTYVDNDCGTLYSNIVYAVKTYLRRTVDGVPEFIRKKDFVLYTLPIYNSQYYSKQDFSQLVDPELNLVLTYKLVEEGSSKIPYTGGSINNGYIQDDFNNYNDYMNGVYDGTNLTLTKYYQYLGNTKLYLEIGLHKDYDYYNLKYDPKINDNFSCNIQLLENDSEKSFNINTTEAPEIALNYNKALSWNNNNQGINKLYFADQTTSMSVSDLTTKNFITNNGQDPITIHYEFVVGYKANISNIVSTEVPATTVCALCHKSDSNSNYNYEDFGIYLHPIDKYFYSKCVFYNGGDLEEEIFGVCTQTMLNDEATKMFAKQGDPSKQPSEVHTRETLLNTGAPLKAALPYVGKLQFCQPHIHCLDSTKGVNIVAGIDNAQKLVYVVIPELNTKFGDQSESSNGTVPFNLVYKVPVCNLSLNTINSINTQSEFISTTKTSVINNDNLSTKIQTTITRTASSKSDKWGMDDYTLTEDMRQYVGFNGIQLAKFNKLLIKTMQNVYAYNPDYDSLQVKTGTTSVENNNISFVSNIISSNSSFKENFDLNKFVCFGNVRVSDYINLLYKYSKTNEANAALDEALKKQLQFIPNLDYCGTNSQKYLVSKLTYNIPNPTEFVNELEFKTSNDIVIKHHNGNIETIPGTQLNKQLLYTFDTTTHKLVQLDVSNYRINWDGTLRLTKNQQESLKGIKESVVYVTRSSDYYVSTDTTYEIASKYQNYDETNMGHICLQGSSITLNDLYYDCSSSDHRLFITTNGQYKSNPRSKVYYRTISEKPLKEWDYEEGDTKYKNCLWLMNGPSFVGLNADDLQKET